MNFDRQHDESVRTAAFQWLSSHVTADDPVVSWSDLNHRFEYGGRRVILIGQYGIFKPAIMELPISIATSPKRPYDDEMGDDNLLRYKYRGTDPYHRDNVGLRTAMEHELPLIYFHGLITGRYLAFWPVRIVGDNFDALEFSVDCGDSNAVDDLNLDLNRDPGEPFGDAKREFVATEMQRRIYHNTFRERVLYAYKHRCSFCQLDVRELLDAAQISPEWQPTGEPMVRDGMSLCRLHHAAFDRDLLGVNPDRQIHVRSDLLIRRDGPTLQHALQALHGEKIWTPGAKRLQPDGERLELRWERFLMTTNDTPAPDPDQWFTQPGAFGAP